MDNVKLVFSELYIKHKDIKDPILAVKNQDPTITKITEQTNHINYFDLIKGEKDNK